MFLHKITLPDGATLDSGAIRSVQLTGQVNDQTDLCPGAACAGGCCTVRSKRVIKVL